MSTLILASVNRPVVNPKKTNSSTPKSPKLTPI